MAPRIEVGIDGTNLEQLAVFWSQALGYEVGDLDSARTYLDLIPPTKEMPVVYLQLVPEPKQVKNRVHLDLYDLDPERLVSRLCGIGAERIGDPQTGSEGGWWQVLADPEGNEFCICQDDHEQQKR